MLESPEFRWKPFQWPKPCGYWFSLLNVYNNNMYLVELNYKCSPFSILAEITSDTYFTHFNHKHHPQNPGFPMDLFIFGPIHEGLNDWRDGFDVLLLRKLMIWLWHNYYDIYCIYWQQTRVSSPLQLDNGDLRPMILESICSLHGSLAAHQITLPEIHQWGSVHSRPAPFSLHPEYEYNREGAPPLAIS